MLVTKESLRRTPLYACHVAAGARMVDYAGWEMPVRYEGVIDEHNAVRREVGIFDVSHMGEIEVSGPQALALLGRLCSNDIAAIAVGGAQYSLICDPDGGVMDDCFNYRLGPERYLTVTNAANHARDLAWFREHAVAYDAEVTDRAADYAMLAVQGPFAREVVQAVAGAPLPARMTVAEGTLHGAPALVCATGYTGEDGVEILLAPDDAPGLWDVLVRRGARPAGLAARDTLRTEACYHLYGNDLSLERGPIEAGLGWCAKEHTGFIGAEAVARARAQGPSERFVCFVIEGRGVARAGDGIVGGGVVTSGTFSPTLEVGIGLGYVPADRAAVGTILEIDVRGTVRRGVVAARPLYERPVPTDH